MDFELLNDMIKYIEENLTQEIDYKKLAKIVGVSEYSLQRIFGFLANESLSNYIRKRRLSKAFEELKTTNTKVIDIAIKYQYDSAISFSRAFKNMFGITPTECRQSTAKFKLYPVLEFYNHNKLSNELNYEIKQLDEMEFYCVTTEAKTHEDILYKIRQLYRKIQNSGLHKKFNEIGMYAMTMQKDGMWKYFVGCSKKYENTKKVIMPKGKWAIFSVGSREQKDIVDVAEIIYTQWIYSTNYKIIEDISYEYYTKDNCYLYILLDEK